MQSQNVTDPGHVEPETHHISNDQSAQQLSKRPPLLELKNCVKNDSGVIKKHAKQTYEEVFGLAIRHGKMTEKRREQLLAKIVKIASNDATAFAGVEQDITLAKDNEAGTIIIDMVAHFMVSDEDLPDQMNVSYAAAKSIIKNATLEQQEKAYQLLQRVVEVSLRGMKMPGGDQERATVQESLTARGYESLLSILQN